MSVASQPGEAALEAVDPSPRRHRQIRHRGVGEARRIEAGERIRRGREERDRIATRGRSRGRSRSRGRRPAATIFAPTLR